MFHQHIEKEEFRQFCKPVVLVYIPNELSVGEQGKKNSYF